MPAISGRWRKSLASIGAQTSSQSPGIWEFGGLTTMLVSALSTKHEEHIALWQRRASIYIP
jgi:hypothetical protein